MFEDINPLAPAEDAAQEEAAPQIPAWAVAPDAARTGPVEVVQLPEGEFVEASTELQEGAATEEPREEIGSIEPEYDGARAYNQVAVRINQGT